MGGIVFLEKIIIYNNNKTLNDVIKFNEKMNIKDITSLKKELAKQYQTTISNIFAVFINIPHDLKTSELKKLSSSK